MKDTSELPQVDCNIPRVEVTEQDAEHTSELSEFDWNTPEVEVTK